MVAKTVKRKVRISYILVLLAMMTFVLSASGLIPESVVENIYARRVFPMISHIAGIVADALPYSWLDIFIVTQVAILITAIRFRSWRFIIGLIAAAYLFFFWSWGLNYHRQGIETKLGIDAGRVSPEQIDEFARIAAGELNRLWPMTEIGSTTAEMMAQQSADRVRAVIAKLDGTDWPAASRIKRSWLINPWFRVAGIDGMFNPMVHEPIVVTGLLGFERPFVMSHELAHVRGYPDEGDANVAALLATVSSDDPIFQYSGWFHVWLYLRTPELDDLLEDGPRLDLQLYTLRAQAQQIPWVSNFQTVMLDIFLKANDVDEGVRSYARLVTFAVASRARWDEFR